MLPLNGEPFGHVHHEVPLHYGETESRLNAIKNVPFIAIQYPSNLAIHQHMVV